MIIVGEKGEIIMVDAETKVDPSKQKWNIDSDKPNSTTTTQDEKPPLDGFYNASYVAEEDSVTKS